MAPVAHRSRSWRFAMVLLGAALSFVSLFVAGVYLLIIGYGGCSGTDASDPPSPGSTAAALCDSAALPVALIACLVVALGAPIGGGLVAAARGRYAPLWASAAAAAGAVSGLGLLLHALEEGTENAALFVGAPLLACVGLALIAMRQSRSDRRQ